MKIFKKFLTLIVSIIFVTCFLACTSKKEVKNNNNNANLSKNSSKTEYPLKIKDSLGREVTIDKEPQKVVSLGPNLTETIFALGEEKKLVGRTDYCDYPSKAKDIPSIGSLQQPSIEKIVDLKPDLVIASTHFKPDTLKKFESLGIQVVAFYGEESFSGAYDTIQNVGKVLNANVKATELVDNMKKKVDFVKSKVNGKSTPSVYYIISFGKAGDFTPGKDTFIDKAITLAGGKNAASDAIQWKYSLEKLIEKNPDIMICSKYFNTKKDLETTNGYKDLKAVKNKKLYEIDNNMLDRQGPRLADGLESMAKIIHPECFK